VNGSVHLCHWASRMTDSSSWPPNARMWLASRRICGWFKCFLRELPLAIATNCHILSPGFTGISDYCFPITSEYFSAPRCVRVFAHSPCVLQSRNAHTRLAIITDSLNGRSIGNRIFDVRLHPIAQRTQNTWFYFDTDRHTRLKSQNERSLRSNACAQVACTACIAIIINND